MSFVCSSLLAASLALAQAGPSSRPASQATSASGRVADIYGELTVIYELGDGSLRAKESWRFRNDAGTLKNPQNFKLMLPKDARRINLDENSAPFEISGSQIEITRSLSQGDQNLGLTYEIPLDSGAAATNRNFPFKVGGIRLIMEDTAGLEVTTSVASSKRTRDLNGIVFAIWDLEAVLPGQNIKVDISGLPSRGTWMRTLMLLASVAVLVWMILSLTQSAPTNADVHTSAPQSVMSASARKTRLLQALELLEDEHTAQALDEEQYRRRKKTLLNQLASAMREQNLEQGSSP
jgi:hypothetical protein